MSPICQAVADGTELQTQIVLHKLLHTEVCTLLPIVTGHQIPAKLLIFLLSGLDVGKKEVPEWYLVLFRSFPSPLLHKFLDSHACIVIRTVSATYRYGVPQKGSYGTCLEPTKEVPVWHTHRWQIRGKAGGYAPTQEVGAPCSFGPQL